jgi:hypothetical protein
MWQSYYIHIHFRSVHVFRTVHFWAIMQRVVVIYYRCFGTTYQSLLQGFYFLLGFLPLKMGPIGCPETRVKNYLCSLRNSPEGHISLLHHRRSIVLVLIPK